MQSGLGDSEVPSDLGDRRFMLASHGHNIATELSGERLRHIDILAPRNISSQVSSQANPRQSRGFGCLWSGMAVFRHDFGFVHSIHVGSVVRTYPWQ